MGADRNVASGFFLRGSGGSEGSTALILIGALIALGFIAVYVKSRRK